MNTHPDLQHADDRMLQRVYSEFLEMPGLRLTSRQAQRLWGLDEATCLELLSALVNAKFLCETGQGNYRRATDGPAARPQLQMLKTSMKGLEHAEVA